MHKNLVIILLLQSIEVFAQQPVPIELTTNPEKYNFAISGMLMGNVDEDELNVNTKNTKTSGRLFLDANITPRLFTSIHINAIKHSNAISTDTFDLASLSFTHNDYKFNFSLAYRYNAKVTFANLFMDYSISELTLEKAVYLQKELLELSVFKFNLGVQIFWQADWDQSLLVSAALKVNRMWVEDNPTDPRALERAFNLPHEETFIRKYNGFSFKTTIQLNNISIFCETQQNYASFDGGPRKAIPGFTKHTFYSVGFTTTSTAILGKRKEDGAATPNTSPKQETF